MLYVLFGKDTYRSRKKLLDITERFYEVAGGRESAVRIVLSESSRSEVEQVLTTGSLFRNKRLFIVEEPSGASSDVLAYMEEHLPALAKSDDVYVIWDRVSVSEHITARAAKTQEFGQFTLLGAARFLDEEAQARGVLLNASEKRRILADAAGDSWRMIQQIEKSALAKGYTNKEVPQTIAGDAPTDRAIFSLVDAYGLSESAKAWQMYTLLVQAGMEPESIFWRMLSHTKTMLSIHSLIERGIGMTDIPREAGVHPFVVKKVAPIVGRMSRHDLLRRHGSLVSLDFQTKQSRGDLALGLERILLSI